MKNRLTRKLFLSIAALGVTAATLTTSTFAWYTSNTEAKVNELSASTEAKGSDSLFISAAQTYGQGGVALTWGGYLAEVTPITTAGIANTTLKPVFSNYSAADLVHEVTGNNPVTAVKGRSYNKIESGVTGSTVTYVNEDNKDFIEFVFRVRSGSTVSSENGAPLYVSSFTLTSTANNASQIALAYGGDTGLTAAGAYSADLLKALKLDVTSAPVTLESGSAIPSTAATTRLAGTTAESNAVTTYGFEALATTADSANFGTANAVGYFNTVMGTSIAAPSTYVAGTELEKLSEASATGALAIATLPKTAANMDFSVVEVRFVLYLDGWDNYCYDIMQNQSVNFSFTLTTSAESSILKAKTNS